MLLNFIKRTSDYFAVLLLLLMTLIPTAEIFLRVVFGFTFAGAMDILQHLTLWVGLFGAILAVRENKHLRIAALCDFFPERFKFFSNIWTYFISALVCWLLCAASIQLITAEAPAITQNIANFFPKFIEVWLEPYGLFDYGNTMKVGGYFPIWIVQLIMPLSFALMGLLFCLLFPQKSITSKLIIILSLPLAILLGIFLPEAPAGSIIAGITILAISAALGAPIFVFIGGAALLLFWSSGVTISAIPAEMYRIVISPVFPTIPLFTLTGFVLSESRTSERFVAVFQNLFGWLPGGTAAAITLLCTFFTTFTGASGITILALGGLLLPILLKSNYSERFSIGLITATGSIGLLFPPSLVVILYSIIAKVSIIDMFKAGILPGIILVSIVCILCFIYGRKADSLTPKNPFNFKMTLLSIWKAKWELLIPIVTLSFIFGGFCSIVEASAITVFYTLVIEIFIYRDLNHKKLFSLFLKCAVLVGGVLIVLGTAMGLTSYLVDAQIPYHISQWALDKNIPKWEFLLLLNVALLLAGCLMDIFSAIIIIVPLILPLAEAFGVDPVHLGIIFLLNLELGYLTPPVGMNLFLAAFRFNKPLLTVARDSLLFLLLFLIVVLAVTYIPFLSTGILELLK